jgi:ribA/ribD-fused uncharacterized protein
MTSSSDVIGMFSGQYRFLSNFYPCHITIDDIEYPTVEHAYQASKVDPSVMMDMDANGMTVPVSVRGYISLLASPGEAKRFGKTVPLIPDWESKKLSIMKGLIMQKFLKPTFQAMLIGTYPSELIEGNTWGDTYWGKCSNIGQNYLGILLMNARTFFMERNGIPHAEDGNWKRDPGYNRFSQNRRHNSRA